MIDIRMLRPVAPALVLCMLAGCATPPGAGGPGNAAANQDPCSIGGSAVVVAGLGAVIGALAGGTKGALIGAAAGAVVGGAGCYAINVRSRQLKTAQQSDSDYVQARGELPVQPTLVSYQVAVSNAVVQRGKPFKVTTDAEIVNGRAEPVTNVNEQLVLFDKQGKAFGNGSKPLQANNATGGRFENSFELKLPPDASQGVYGMKTNLYVNGRLAGTRDLHTQLVWDGQSGVLLASR
ncbi:hypothetical protein [Burkholderia sp. 22PA0106]|uniref:hypothetical protein n=1 Tax=Burkholderia sp. 22PA0106 TaxID=3237371 RepID=UPI0039C10C84